MTDRKRFRLQKILKLRHYQEQQERFRLAAAAGECAQLKQTIQELTQHRQANFQTYSLTDVTLMRACEAFGQRLDKEIKKHQVILTQKVDEHQIKKHAFLEAQKKRKVLENVQEKQKTILRQQENRHQVLMTDDLNSVAYIIKKKGLIHDH